MREKRKIGIFLDERSDRELSKEIQMSMLGSNTGNQLFFHAIKEQIQTESLPRNTKEIVDLEDYDAFITTDFVWIREHVDMSYMKKYLKLIGDKALVPISIGLQAQEYKRNFKIHSETIAILKTIEERCVMGVRGNYTAEILNQYGIKNIQVIGCPSLYQLETGFQKKNKSFIPRNISVNFRSFGEKLSFRETEFLLYARQRNSSFVEQTLHSLERNQVLEEIYYRDIFDWIQEQGNLFLNLSEWRDYMKTIDFCMGSRFHGNVVALWEGVPALFLLTDSRTRELCDFFKLPCIEMKKFNNKKSILYYLKKADYSEFNRNFLDKKRKYEEFLKKNGLK